MNSRQLASRLAIVLAATTVTQPLFAGDGRYRARVIQGGASPQVLLIDSRDGHFWTWRQTIRGSDQELRYEGQLRPGSNPGETIQRTEVRRPAR